MESKTSNETKVDNGFTNITREAIDAMRDDFRSVLIKDPTHIKKVKISAVATIKMLNHANSGVEKGIKTSITGKPVEVMGLLLGRPDTSDGGITMIITDAFPLAVEGAETRVVTDDQTTMNYMTDLADTLEHTRAEYIMGWYHSHPFDVDVNSHCYLSATDVQTQLSYQNSEKEWIAIVVDPLRSLAKQKPELMAFRCYPPSYTGQKENQTPDGTIDLTETRVTRWGSCWKSYYVCQTSFFTSDVSRNLLGILSKSILWMRTLSSTPMLETESRERLADRVDGSVGKLNDASKSGSSLFRLPTKGDTKSSNTSLEAAGQSSAEISLEQIQTQIAQIAKDCLFNPSRE